MNSFKIIGLMSGTSLDGVDVTYATYSKVSEKHWEFTIHASHTFQFSEILLSSLHEASKLSGSQLMTLDHDLGIFFSSCIHQFIAENGLKTEEIDAIASHGQTIFHQPARGFTTQIGNPAVIAVKTGIRTIGDLVEKLNLECGFDFKKSLFLLYTSRLINRIDIIAILNPPKFKKIMKLKKF